MHRREFLGGVAATMAGGIVAGCASGLRSGESRSASVDRAPTTAAEFHSARRQVQTRFGRIAYVERGSGAAALFLHGFPLNGFQWRGALDRLSSERRCLAPDFLALGYTEVAEGQSVAPEDQVAMLVSFLDALSVPVVDVVASDSGGAVAQLLVARHRERVRTLLLTNCDTEIDSPPPALRPVIKEARAGTFADTWLLPWFVDKPAARSAAGIGGMCYVDPAHPSDEAIDYYFAPLLSSPLRKAQLHAYALALERNALLGVEPVLRRSSVPTRILWGTADDIFSARSPDYLDRTFGRSQGVRRLAGRKLFFPEEVPEIIAEEARRLWEIA